MKRHAAFLDTLLPCLDAFLDSLPIVVDFMEKLLLPEQLFSPGGRKNGGRKNMDA